MRYDLFELSVAVPSKHGSTKIPEFGHKGLTFVEGRKGQRFTLKLRNDAAQRVMAVISIDGLSVLDGQPCTEKSRGYVIPAYSTVEVEGWRTSLSKVNEFTFETKEQSYAKTGETNSTQNCGVIAAKFFSEKIDFSALMKKFAQDHKEEHHHHHYHNPPPAPRPYPWPYSPIWYCATGAGTVGDQGVAGNAGTPIDTNMLRCTLTNSMGETVQYGSAAPASSEPKIMFNATSNNITQAEVPEFTLGTGWGNEKTDVVTETTFDVEKELCTLTLYYAEATYMEKVGIETKKEAAVTRPATPVLPQAFAGFCKPPVNR